MSTIPFFKKDSETARVERTTISLKIHLSRCFNNDFTMTSANNFERNCSFRTIHGSQCSRKAKYNLESTPACGIHYNTHKKSEDCAVCFECLKSEKCITLKCRHIFHVKCLAKCVKRECPMCRAKLDPSDCFEVYSTSIIKPLVERVFLNNESDQQRLFNNILCLLNLQDKSPWLSLNTSILCEIILHSSIPEGQLYFILKNLSAMFAHVESHKTLEGFQVNYA